MGFDGGTPLAYRIGLDSWSWVVGWDLRVGRDGFRGRGAG